MVFCVLQKKAVDVIIKILCKPFKYLAYVKGIFIKMVMLEVIYKSPDRAIKLLAKSASEIRFRDEGGDNFWKRS